MPERAIAILGVGYIGLPLALALARHWPAVVAYDIDRARIAELRAGRDRNDTDGGRIDPPPSLRFADDPAGLAGASVFVIAAPTPIDANRRPDLEPLRAACRTVGRAVEPGGLVVVESTVYPGATEEVCGPLIAEVSGLRQGRDFKLAYSPERINPGDRRNTLETARKVVAGEDAETLERTAAIYAPAIPAGLHRAPSIQVAEAAKIVENVQRDLNIALMNELATIFDRMGLRTADVIEAAATKWNFQRFTPGLVGGHCIGVDPYYLISRAESLGCHPEVIRAARRLNDGMAEHVARRTADLLAAAGRPAGTARVGVLGMAFKEDVSDIRNSQSPALARALARFGATVLSHDPHADPARLRAEHGVELCAWEELRDLDALALAVPHAAYLSRPRAALAGMLRPGGVVVDVKSALDPGDFPGGAVYWSLLARGRPAPAPLSSGNARAIPRPARR